MKHMTSTSRALGARRRLVVGGALALGLFVPLAACGSSDDNDSSSSDGGAITLTLSVQSSGGGTKVPEAVLAEEYTKQNPDVKFDVQQTDPDNYSQLLLTQLQGGSGPDIFYGTAGYGSQHSLAPLGDAGYALSLTGTPAEDMLSSTGQLDLYTGKSGDIYGQPENFVPLGIVYNKDALDKAGLTYPETFDQLLADCKKARDAGVNYFSEPAGDDLAGVVMAASNVYAQDPDWRKKREDGSTTFADTPGWVATLNDYTTLNDSGCFQPGVAGSNNDAAFADVGSGKSLGVIMPSGVIYELAGSNPGVNFVIAPFPGHTADTTRVFASSTDALGINAKLSDEKKAAALKFLAWLAEPEQATQLADATKSIPLSAIKDGKLESSGLDPMFDPMVPLLSDPSRYQPYDSVLWPNGDVSAALLDGLTGLLTGQASVDDVLSSMDEAWNKGPSTS